VFLIAIPLILLALALVGGSILMLRLFALSVLVILASYLWTLLTSRGIEVRAQKLPEYAQVGDYIDEEITVFNKSRVPKLLLEIRENTNLPGHHNTLAFNLSPGSSHSWQAKAHCQRRGQYYLGSFTARFNDFFGFFSLHRDLGEPQQVLVYPATLELPLFWPLSQGKSGYGLSRWAISESSPNAARVREYVTGDSLNHIHWHSTAHTGKLMVKVFDPDRSNKAAKNIWIVVDMHQASHLGDGDGTTEEYCITIAASLLKKYIDNGRPVGLVASGDQSYLFPPQLGDHHLWRTLEALALMKATSTTPIDQLVSNKLESFDSSSAIIVITPAVNERVTASLRRITNRGIMAVAILLDPVSFGGTISAMDTANRLTANKIPAYIVRRAETLAAALDNISLSPYTRRFGDVVKSG